MASSEKAGALKDAFVNAIANELGEEKMAQAGAMENAKLAGKLGMDVGDQAGVMMDLPSGKVFSKNDGRNIFIVKDNNKSRSIKVNDPDYGFPVPGGAYGATSVEQMPASMQREGAIQLHNSDVGRVDHLPYGMRNDTLPQQYDLFGGI